MADSGGAGAGDTERLDHQEIGLASETPPPFVFVPAVRPSPLVISFPHVGLDWPSALGPRPQVNFLRNADYEVHRLYAAAPARGAAILRARYTRLVIDLNRADDDVSRRIVPDHPNPRPHPHLTGSDSPLGRTIRNRGVLWRTAVGNIPLFDTLPYAALELRLRDYYWPYRRAIERLLARRRERFGYAILLDAHSMPGSVGEDLVLGTRNSEACSAGLRDRAFHAISSSAAPVAPLRAKLDDPYRGGDLVRVFGRPADGLHALQLEVSRALYMDEYRLDLWQLPPTSTLGPHDTGSSGASRPRLVELHRRVNALVDVLAEPIPELARSS